MKVIASGKTDVGLKRQVNQDAFLCDDDLGFYVVADGMGGHAAGEIASSETIEAVHDMVLRNRAIIDSFRSQPLTRESGASIRRLLESSVQAATYLVYGLAEQSPRCHGMGTTVSAILFSGAHGVTAQVGDTRIYCLRDGEAIQLTEDHTLINWQLREGVITAEEARQSPHRNVITRAVGNKDYVEVDTQIISVQVGDRFILCSDGLHGYIKRHELQPLVGHLSRDEACKVLVDLSNDRGGRDNITVVVIDVGD